MSGRTLAQRSGWAGLALVLSAMLFCWPLTNCSAGSSQAEATGGDEDVSDKIVKSEDQWKERLSSEEYRVLREKGTERPFSGKYNKFFEDGTYLCAACGQELFASDSKYDSGSGWPAFSSTANDTGVASHEDRSLGMARTEVTCSRCGGHLGHVFEDGPEPTGMRYCVNSASLEFQAAGEAAADDNKELEAVVLGAGCFWCTEAAFEWVDGVTNVDVGYMGGEKRDADYKKVCSGQTGHAEVARITYDPKRVSFQRILDLYFAIHDPTTLNRQGVDVGPQYRSVIFYSTEEQKAAAQKAVEALNAKYADPVVTQVVPAAEYYLAEDYHQDYFRNNPEAGYCQAVIAPKLKKAKKLP